MADNDSGEKPSLQQLVDLFHDLGMLLESVPIRAVDLLSHCDEQQLEIGFLLSTGDISAVRRRGESDTTTEDTLETESADDETIRRTKRAGDYFAHQLGTLFKTMRLVELALEAIPKQASELLDGVGGSDWRTHVIRHCLIPIRTWPVQKPGQCSWELVNSRSLTPQRVDVFLGLGASEYRLPDEWKMLGDHWQGVCESIQSYVDDIRAVAVRLSIPLSVGGHGDENIPPEYRSLPMTKAEIASIHSGSEVTNPTTYLQPIIDDGSLRIESCGSKWVVDIRGFPEKSHCLLLPKSQ